MVASKVSHRFAINIDERERCRADERALIHSVNTFILYRMPTA